MFSNSTFIKKNWNENKNSPKGNKLNEKNINKLFTASLKLPGTLPNVDNNNGNLCKMGYVYQDEIPNEEIISKTINTTDPFYTDYFLSRGGNNK